MPCGDHQAVGAQDDPWHSSDDQVAGAQGGQSDSPDDRVAVEPDEQWGQPVRHQSQPDAAVNQFDQWQEDEEPRVSHREERLLAQKSLLRIWAQEHQQRAEPRPASQQPAPQQVSQRLASQLAPQRQVPQQQVS